jgi:hypothetical protein
MTMPWFAATTSPRYSTAAPPRPLSAAARAELSAPSSEHALRAPPRVSDQMIHPHTQAWLHALPAACWPVHLASRYPRIANQLALAWPDAVLCDLTFERLLSDERGGRQGFPAPVLEDLLALRRLRARQASTDSRRMPWGGLRLVEAPSGAVGRASVAGTCRR